MADKEVIQSDELFVSILCLIIGSLLLLNIYAFFMGSYITLMAILLQGVVLISIYRKYRSQILLIKIWSAMAIVSGALGFIGMFFKLFVNILKDDVALNEGITTYFILYSAFAFGIGYYFYSEVQNKIKIVVLRDDDQRSQSAD